MELHAPRAVAEPEGLCAHAVARQLDGARRHIVGVVVPLKRVEGWRQPSEDRVLRARLGQLDREPADFGLLGGKHGRVRRLREQLRPEADSEDGHVQIEQPLQEQVLLPQPGMMIVLVGMHRAAEHEHRAVCV